MFSSPKSSPPQPRRLTLGTLIPIHRTLHNSYIHITFTAEQRLYICIHQEVRLGETEKTFGTSEEHSATTPPPIHPLSFQCNLPMNGVGAERRVATECLMDARGAATCANTTKFTSHGTRVAKSGVVSHRQ